MSASCDVMHTPQSMTNICVGCAEGLQQSRDLKNTQSLGIVSLANLGKESIPSLGQGLLVSSVILRALKPGVNLGQQSDRVSNNGQLVEPEHLCF